MDLYEEPCHGKSLNSFVTAYQICLSLFLVTNVIISNIADYVMNVVFLVAARGNPKS